MAIPQDLLKETQSFSATNREASGAHGVDFGVLGAAEGHRGSDQFSGGRKGWRKQDCSLAVLRASLLASEEGPGNSRLPGHSSPSLGPSGDPTCPWAMSWAHSLCPREMERWAHQSQKTSATSG